jgi:hypothetical protein
MNTLKTSTYNGVEWIVSYCENSSIECPDWAMDNPNNWPRRNDLGEFEYNFLRGASGDEYARKVLFIVRELKGQWFIKFNTESFPRDYYFFFELEEDAVAFKLRW